MPASRFCVVCLTTFTAPRPDVFWCSSECESKLDEMGEVLAEMNATAHLDVGDTASEGEVARRALGIVGASADVERLKRFVDRPMPAVDTDDDEYFSAARMLIEAARELSAPVERLELARVAESYLARAIAVLEEAVRE